MKKIAIIGTHGVGKTTLCKAVAEYARAQGKKVESIGEVVRDCPYPIHAEQTYKATEWIVINQILREREAEGKKPDLIVCDRSVYDPIVYLENAVSIFNQTVHEQNLSCNLRSFCKNYINDYNYICYITPFGKTDLKLDDGFRSIDIAFQEEIENIFHKTFAMRIYVKRLPSLISVIDRTTLSCEIFKSPAFLAKEIYDEIF
jgi:thymidylate kinase